MCPEYECVQDECVEALKHGELLAIAPGGSREGLFAQVGLNGKVARDFKQNSCLKIGKRANIALWVQ